MNQDIYSFNNKIYSNNNNLLFGVINDLQQINNITNDNSVIKKVGDIIMKVNFIINENKKNTELIINHITLLQNQMKQMNKKFDGLKFNNINQINNKEIKYKSGRYIGQVVNGIPEGKGIYYYNNGDRMMGDYFDDNQIGKHVMLTKNRAIKTCNY